MYYFRYTEVLSSGTNPGFTLDKGNYSDNVVEYLSSHDIDTGARIFIVQADLQEADLDPFIKLQRVTMEEISQEQYDALKVNSEDYRSRRALSKEARNDEIASCTVSYRDIIFDADESSIARMSSRVALYNFRFNQLIANGYSKEQAYQAYDDILLWRASDKNTHKITVKDLIEILSLAISKVEDTIMKY